MFSNGWIWMVFAFFIVSRFGGFGGWRRARWGRWDRDAAEDSQRLPQGSREDGEKDRRREEQVEQLEARVAELESRLDFAERLLAPRRDQLSGSTQKAVGGG